jgi:hypothetical protein
MATPSLAISFFMASRRLTVGTTLAGDDAGACCARPREARKGRGCGGTGGEMVPSGCTCNNGVGAALVSMYGGFARDGCVIGLADWVLFVVITISHTSQRTAQVIARQAAGSKTGDETSRKSARGRRRQIPVRAASRNGVMSPKDTCSVIRAFLCLTHPSSSVGDTSWTNVTQTAGVPCPNKRTARPVPWSC